MAIDGGLEGGLLVGEGVHSAGFVQKSLCFGFVVGRKGQCSEMEAALGIVTVAVHPGGMCTRPAKGREDVKGRDEERRIR